MKNNVIEFIVMVVIFVVSSLIAAFFMNEIHKSKAVEWGCAHYEEKTGVYIEEGCPK